MSTYQQKFNRRRWQRHYAVIPACSSIKMAMWQYGNSVFFVSLFSFEFDWKKFRNMCISFRIDVCSYRVGYLYLKYSSCSCFSKHFFSFSEWSNMYKMGLPRTWPKGNRNTNGTFNFPNVYLKQRHYAIIDLVVVCCFAESLWIECNRMFSSFDGYAEIFFSFI